MLYYVFKGDCNDAETQALMAIPRCGMPDINNEDDVEPIRRRMPIGNQHGRQKRYVLQGMLTAVLKYFTIFLYRSGFSTTFSRSSNFHQFKNYSKRS